MIITRQNIRSEESLNALIKKYLKRATEIERVLIENPHDWGEYQNEFNQSVGDVFKQIMEFDWYCTQRSEEHKLYKLKKFFIKHFREFFLKGQLIRHSFEKPFGYAGDFQIIDYIYKCQASSTGFDRLFDNLFLSSAASSATRHRKEDFKSILLNLAKSAKAPLAVLDLASGPCRDIYELLQGSADIKEKLEFTCLDGDLNAIAFAKQLMCDFDKVTYIHENVVRVALKKNVEAYLGRKFDVIFSTGLFDYLDERLALRLISNLKRLLNPGGKMIISNYRDKFSNPSLHFMEWVGDWPLVYRTDDEFRRIFLDAGFSSDALSHTYEMQGIMIYISAISY